MNHLNCGKYLLISMYTITHLLLVFEFKFKSNFIDKYLLTKLNQVIDQFYFSNQD